MKTPKGFIGSAPIHAPTQTMTTQPINDGGVSNAVARSGSTPAVNNGAEIRALGSVGRVLANLGGEGQDLAQQLQVAKNAKVEAEIMSEWDVALAEHNANMLTNPDPESRVASMKRTLSDLKTKTFNREYMPQVLRDRLAIRFAKLEGQQNSRALSEAASMYVEQAKDAIGVRMDKAIDAGNIDGYRAIVADGLESGLFSRQKAEEMLYKGEKEITFRNLETLAGQDPDYALEQVADNPAISKGHKRHIERVAMARIRVETKDQIEYAEGRLELIRSPEEIDEMAEGLNRLTPRDVSALKKHWANEREPTAEEVVQANKLMNHLAKNKSALNDDEYHKAFYNVERYVKSVTRKGYNGHLKTRLNSMSPYALQKDHMSELREIGHEKIQYAKDAGWHGISEKQANRDLFTAEWETDMVNEFNSWVEENPNATKTDARKEVSRMLGQKRAQESINASAPPSAGLLPLKNSLQSDLDNLISQ